MAGEPNVTVTLDGRSHEMVPTLGAAQGISRSTGGLRKAMDLVAQLDVDAIALIVQLGIGPEAVKTLGGADRIPELVFEAGFTGELASKCVTYLSRLATGGRPLAPPPPTKK